MFQLTKTKGKVNLIIKNHVVRYVESQSNSLDGIIDFGEKPLSESVFKDGEITDNVVFSQVIEDLVDENDWKNKPMNFCVPDASVVIRPYQVPANLKESEIKGYIFMQLGDTLHLPFEFPSFDFHIIDQNEETYQLLLFASPENQVESLSTIFSNHKLKPKSADISSLAVYRLYDRLGRSNPEDHLLSIQWNVDSCILTVFHGLKPIFVRNMKSPLPIGEWKYKQGGFHWKGDQAEYDEYYYDQLSEIERIMNFYRFSVMNGESGVNRILLTGDSPDLNRVRLDLDERFQLPVDQMEHELQTKDGRTIPDSFIEAVGLSIKKQ
ncbi:type IV pilus biogenesis protein PilM [Thalassobacillus hwangdonensis]|uniref:Type IV pilus biogenesis protein PilM n=1 Tax=Thalassobacillus hwangdonensis TaxID=546108 RepID=A0ABW3L1M8_9BACI